MAETHPVWNMAYAVAPQCTMVVSDDVCWPFLLLLIIIFFSCTGVKPRALFILDKGFPTELASAHF